MRALASINGAVKYGKKVKIEPFADVVISRGNVEVTLPSKSVVTLEIV